MAYYNSRSSPNGHVYIILECVSSFKLKYLILIISVLVAYIWWKLWLNYNINDILDLNNKKIIKLIIHGIKYFIEKNAENQRHFLCHLFSKN